MYNKTNTFLKKSKKGFIEVTSFALLTSLILVLSLTTYVVVNNILDNKIISLERENIELTFKKLNIELQNIQNFPGSSMSYPINTKKGVIIFTPSEMKYYSLVEFKSSSPICFDNLCYNSNGGFETLALQLDAPYTFKSNFTLSPENYQLIFTNNGVNQIDIKFK